MDDDLFTGSSACSLDNRAWQGVAICVKHVTRKFLRLVGFGCLVITCGLAQEAEFQQTIEALQRGELEVAERLAREALEKSAADDQPAARNLLGMVLGQAGRYEEAIDLFKRNADANPQNAGAFANWAQALRRAGRSGEAIAPMEKAVELLPDSALYAFQLRLARIESGEDEAVGRTTMGQLQENPAAADWLLTAAAIALHREKWDEAKTLLTQAKISMELQYFAEILQDPAFLKHADREELAGVFPTLEIRPAAGAKTLEAVQAYQVGKLDEALELLQQAAQAGEPEGPISTVRGGVLMAQKKFGDAADAFELAVRSSPGDPSLYLNHGESLRAAKRYREASEAFQIGLRMEPGNELLGLKLAFSLIEAGQAAGVLNTGLKDAKQGPLLLGKAAAAASLGEVAMAAEFFEDARESMPPDAFGAMLQDPVFAACRETDGLSGFFPAPR